jgi:hypothetical protein
MSILVDEFFEELYSDQVFIEDLEEYKMRQASERMEEEANQNQNPQS